MKKIWLCLWMVLMAGYIARADLLLYFDFEGEDPGSTVVTDKSGYGFNGTRSYPVSWGAGYDILPQYVPSHDGSTAMRFGYSDSGTAGGAYNYIKVGTGYNDTLARVAGGFTMAFWARQDLSGNSPWGSYYGPAYPRIISTPNYEIELGAGDNGDPASYFWPFNANPPWGVPQSWDMTMANNPEDVWFHMAVTYDGTTFTQYINGVAVFSNNQMVPFVDSTWDDFPDDVALTIGTQCYPIEKSFLVGLLDDVAIWNQCLTTQQVAGLYTGELTPLDIPEPASLVLLALGGLLLRKKR
jgi:hypothetical protein